MAAPVYASDFQPSIDTSSSKYQACNRLVSEAPSRAVEYAKNWRHKALDNSSDALSATHCMAVAQFKLKNYKISAQSFDSVHDKISKSKIVLRSSLKRQSARAWVLAGEPDAALSALDMAAGYITHDRLGQGAMNRLMLDILLDKVDIFIGTGEYMRAIQSLDHAESISPGHQTVAGKRTQIYDLLSTK